MGNQRMYRTFELDKFLAISAGGKSGNMVDLVGITMHAYLSSVNATQFKKSFVHVALTGSDLSVTIRNYASPRQFEQLRIAFQPC